MPTVTPIVEKRHDGGFLVSRDLGTYTTDPGVLLAGTKYFAGLVLGRITASQKLVAWNPAAVDGSQVVAGVLYGTRDATVADKPCAIVNRVCQVNAAELLWFTGATAGNITTGLGQLKTLGVIAV